MTGPPPEEDLRRLLLHDDPWVSAAAWRLLYDDGESYEDYRESIRVCLAALSGASK